MAPLPARFLVPFRRRFVAALVGVVLNLAEGEVGTYIDNKKKQFSASYSATLSSSPGDGAFEKGSDISTSKQKAYIYEPEFDCIHVYRTVKEKDNPKAPAFDAYVAIETDKSGISQRLVPRSVKLSRAAALTDNSTRKVDVSLELKIVALSAGEKGPTNATVVDQVINYPGLLTPGGNAGITNDAAHIYACPPEKPNDEGCKRFVGSGWYPGIPKVQADIDRCNKDAGCKGVTQYQVSALVTETGSGADAFGTLGTTIDGNKAGLNSALTDYIKTLLTPASTTSSGH